MKIASNAAKFPDTQRQLQMAFGDPDETHTAVRELNQLHQANKEFSQLPAVDGHPELRRTR